MISTWSRKYPLGSAFLAGIFLATSFAKFNWLWAAWIAPGLMLFAALGAPGQRTFRTGYVAGAGFCLASYYWALLIPFPLYGFAGWLALAAILSVYYGLWCWVCGRLRPTCHQWAWPFLCAAAWVAMEMLMTRLFTGWAWNLLGESQFRFLALAQVASVTGVYGIGFLLVWFSVSLMEVRRKPVLMAAPLGVIAIVVVCGVFRMATEVPERGTIKIALVQPAIPQPVIWDLNEKTNRFLKLVELSRLALAAEPDLLVWPEASMPDMFKRTLFTQQTIQSLMRVRPVWMAIGANDSAPKTNAASQTKSFNSAFLIDPTGEIRSRYNKCHLVPFGEYMPWAGEFPFLAKLRTAGAGLTPGNRAVSFQINKPAAKFATLICFEDVFPQEARPRVDEDTDFLLNLTNDGWFGQSAEQWQHAICGLFRAIENGLPLVRCTNNGLTCWVDACGRLHEVFFPGSKDIYQEGLKIVQVPLRKAGSATFYNRHGDWFGWSCLGLALVAQITKALGHRPPALNIR